MSMMRLLLVCSAALLLVLPDRLAAQALKPFDHTTTLAVNPIRLHFGAQHFAVQEGVGFFVGLRSGIMPPEDENYDEIIGQRQVDYYGDDFVKDREVFFTLNGGPTVRLSDRMALWGGVGLGYRVLYMQYDDPTGILSESGRYWIAPDDEERLAVNALAGVVGRMSNHVSLAVGYETTPQGLLFSVGYVW